MPHLLTLKLRLQDISGTPWRKMPHIDTRSYFTFPNLFLSPDPIFDIYIKFRIDWWQCQVISTNIQEVMAILRYLKKYFFLPPKVYLSENFQQLEGYWSIKNIFFAQKLPKMSLFHYSWAKNDISTKKVFSCPIY